MNNKLIDKSYLLDNPKSQILPPTETKIDHLPIEHLSWGDFERLCLRLVQTFHSIENCEIYGVPGSKQEGIDIFAFKESEKYDCFQCKKYKEIFPGKLDEIIQEFKNGEWSSKSDRFYLCTSLPLNSTKLQNKFNSLKEDLNKIGIELIKWDSEQIKRILKKHPSIVMEFFGKEWLRLFCGEKITNSENEEIKNLTKKIEELKDLIINGQSTDKINSIIEEVYDKEYYWIETENVKLFNKLLKDSNDTIIDKREKFTFSQKVIQSIFSLSDLKEIVEDWNKDSFTPENLDHLRFIHSGLLAYSCLEKIPKDILQDLKLLNWCPIHHGYFAGYLGKFIREIELSMKLKKDLIAEYSSDRYLFENLTRIINSLKRFLEFDVNELYVEKSKAFITRNLPKRFLVITTLNEITIRNPKNLNRIYAKLPLDKQLDVFKIEIITTINSTIIVGANARDCFHWNPEKDLVAHYFYNVSYPEKINNLFCKVNEEDEIETTLQIGNKILIFLNFKIHKTFDLNYSLELNPYKNHFIGLKKNYLNSSGALIYFVKEDFHPTPLTNIEDLRKIVDNFQDLKNWKNSLNIDQEYSKLFYVLQNIDIQIIKFNSEDLILIRGSIDRTSVILIAKAEINSIKILYIHHLKESITITIDYQIVESNIVLYCGYLDLYRRDSVFEIIRIENFTTIETHTISRVRESDNCRDILDILVCENGDIFLNEEGNKVLHYINEKKIFIENKLDDSKILSIKYHA